MSNHKYFKNVFIHTYIRTYIYIYVYICVCVCVYFDTPNCVDLIRLDWIVFSVDCADVC